MSLGDRLMFRMAKKKVSWFLKRSWIRMIRIRWLR